MNSKFSKIMLITIVGLTVSGCTDGKLARLQSVGSGGEITCYSGGKVILQDKSTGIIGSEEQSDGWYFNSATTNRLVRVSGDCVIKN